MYSQRIIDANLEREQVRIRAMLGDQKFELKRHSPDACQHARKVFDQEKVQIRYAENKLTKEEKRWIVNERALCRYDYPYYLTHYHHIETADNRVVLLNANLAQQAQIYQKALLEEKGLGVEIQNLKARQVGVTTETEADACHRITFFSNVNAVVASSNPNKSRAMSDKMATGWDNLPIFMLPEKGRWNSKLMEFAKQNSGVEIGSGAQFNGLARGATPTVAHCSELSEWNDPRGDIDNAMLRAMHSNPEMLIVLESTALMMNDWWHMTWKQAVSGKNRFTPRFYGWYLAPDFYPTPTDLLKFPVPVDWIPPDYVIKYAEKCRRYVIEDPVVVKIVGSNYQFTKDQLWYYFREYEAAKERHALNDFLREMPGTADEAWQVTGYSIFDAEVLQDGYVNCKQPVGVYGFRASSETIPLRLQAAEYDIDTDKPPIDISCEWVPNHKVEATLVPLKWKGYGTFEDSEGRGKVFIWEWPRIDHDYGVPIDTSEGIGQNQAVIGAIRKQTNREFAEQVMEYASTWVNPIDLINIGMILGTLYSPPRANGDPNQAKLIAEVKSESDITQFEMTKHGWYHFHSYVSIDQVNINPYRSTKKGWYTTPWSRKRIMAWFIYNIKLRHFIINSPWALNECKTLHKDMYEQALRAEAGAMDDRVMQLAFGWYALHELDERDSEMRLMQMMDEVKLGGKMSAGAGGMVDFDSGNGQDVLEELGIGMPTGASLREFQRDPIYGE